MISARHIKEIAKKAGADMCGIAPIDRMKNAPPEMNPGLLWPNVKSIVGFVNDIGAEPIADGVYNSRQAEMLYSFECSYCAGTLAGKYMTERYVRRKNDE